MRKLSHKHFPEDIEDNKDLGDFSIDIIDKH